MAQSRRTLQNKSRTRKVRMAGGANIPRSVMGSLMPPVNVTSEKQLPELDKRISTGPVTLVFIYAPWCGHCKNYEPTMDSLEAMPNRSIQIARVRDDMFPKSSIASNKLDGYPTLMLFKHGEAVKFKDSQGKMTNSIPNYKDNATMKAIVENMGTPSGMNILKGTLNNVTPNKERVSNGSVGNKIVRKEGASKEGASKEGVSKEGASKEGASKENGKNRNAENNYMDNNNVFINNNLMNNTTNAEHQHQNQHQNQYQTPNNIVADRMSPPRVSELNRQLQQSNNPNIQSTVREGREGSEGVQRGGGRGEGEGEQQGGGLFSSLSAVANNLAPAAAFFLGSEILSSRGTRKHRHTTHRTTQKA